MKYRVSLTCLITHVNFIICMATSICDGGRHKGIRSLLLLLRIRRGYRVGIEVKVKEECIRLGFPYRRSAKLTSQNTAVYTGGEEQVATRALTEARTSRTFRGPMPHTHLGHAAYARGDLHAGTRTETPGVRVTYEVMSGCSANGWACFGKTRTERTRTGDENLIAARFEGPDGSSVHQCSSICLSEQSV